MPTEVERVHLQGLGEIVVRPLRRPGDRPAYLRFGAAIAPDDLRLRFAGPVKPDLALARRLLALDGTAFAAFDGHGDILGIGRTVGNEIAVTVRSDLKRRGLGRALLERLVRHAVEQGMTELVGTVLAENHPMLALARTAGFRAIRAEGNTVSIRLGLPGADNGNCSAGPGRRSAALRAPLRPLHCPPLGDARVRRHYDPAAHLGNTGRPRLRSSDQGGTV